MKTFISKTFRSDDRAKELRRNATSAEVVLWQYLRRNTLGVHFRRQCPVGGYILDFYCNSIKLCVEIDGSVHESVETCRHDTSRTAFLNDMGITVLRYDNDVVFNNVEGILLSIQHFIDSPRFIKGDCRNMLL